MFWTTITFTWVIAWLNTILAAFATRPAAALLGAGNIHLYTAGPAPDGTQVASNYTEATFSGYAMIAFTLAGPVLPSPNTTALIANADFVAVTATPFVGDTILGYYVTDTGGNLVGVEVFTSPATIAAPGDFVTVNLVLPLQVYSATL